MLRLANQNDFPEILRMAKRFYEISPYKNVGFSPERCLGLFQAYLLGDKRELVIILAEDEKPFGMVIGQSAIGTFTDQKISVELAWWVDEDHRGNPDSLRLLQAYEDWSRRVGSSVCQVAMLPEVGDLSKLYKRLGYRETEASYCKFFKEP